MTLATIPTLPDVVGFKYGTGAGPSQGSLGGSTITVGGNTGDLAALLALAPGATNSPLNADRTHRGNTYILPAGATYLPGVGSTFTFPVTAGAGWTRFKTSGTLPAGTIGAAATRVSSANAAQMPLFRQTVPGTAVATIPLGSNGWIFEGINGTCDLFDATHPIFFLWQCSGNRVIFRQCYLHGHPNGPHQRRALLITGSDSQVWDSWFSEWQDDSDCQTIWYLTRKDYTGSGGVAATDRHHVENNHLSASTEITMVGDQTSSFNARHLTFRRNHYFKPLFWHQPNGTDPGDPGWDNISRAVKNHCEIKAGAFVLYEGNTYENSWSAAQPGEAMVMNAGTNAQITDVTFQHNKVINGTQIATVSSGFSDAAHIPQRVRIYNVLSLGANTNREAFFNWDAPDTSMEHCTQVPSTSTNPSYQGLGGQVSGPGKWARNTFQRNIFGKAMNGLVLLVNGSQVGNTDAVWNGQMPDREHHENVALWNYGTGLAGVKQFASMAAAGVNADGTLTATSPLKVGQPGYFGTDGKDIGVDFAALNAVMGGTGQTFSIATPTGISIVRV